MVMALTLLVCSLLLFFKHWKKNYRDINQLPYYAYLYQKEEVALTADGVLPPPPLSPAVSLGPNNFPTGAYPPPPNAAFQHQSSVRSMEVASMDSSRDEEDGPAMREASDMRYSRASRRPPPLKR